MNAETPAESQHLAAETIRALHEGQLDPASEEAAEAHLATCEPCTAVAAGMIEQDQLPRWRELLRAAPLDATKPPAAPLPALAGYDVLYEIGEGAFSVVYLARQRRLDRLVALKVLNGARATTEQRQRFEREARALAGVDSPHVLRVYDSAEVDGRPCLVLEYVPGEDLRKRWGGRPQEPAVAARLLVPLARALHAVHRSGLVHRDLKPANVLVAPDGTPKVADFGFALLLTDGGAVVAGDPQTRTNQVIGTPEYMAPEQARGKKRARVGPAADIYALGAILYQGLTGRPPHVGDTSLETIKRVVRDDPVPPRRLQPGIPRALEWICLQCLRKAPKKRYTSAEALAEDLELFLGGEEQKVSARPESRRAWVWRKCRAAPVQTLLAVAAGLFLLVAAGSIGFIYHFRQERRQAEAEAAEIRDLDLEHAGRTVRFLAEDPRLKQANFLDTRERLLKMSAAHFQKLAALARRQGGTREARANQAQALLYLGQLRLGMTKLPEARADYEQARELYAELSRLHPDETRYRRALAEVVNELGILAAQEGRREDALPLFQEALAQREQLARELDGEPDVRHDLATAQMNLGNWYLFFGGDVGQAIAFYDRCLPVHRELVVKFPDNWNYRFKLAHALDNYGMALLGLGKADRAKALHREALTHRRELVKGELKNHENLSYLASTLNHLGNALKVERKLAAAAEAYRDSARTLEELAVEYPQVPSHRHEAAMAYINAGPLYRRSEPDKARGVFGRATQLLQGLAEKFPNVPLYAVHLGVAQVGLGDWAADRGQWAEALVHYTAAVAKVPADPESINYRAEAQAGQAVALCKLGRAADGLQAAEAAAATVEAAPASDGEAPAKVARALALAAASAGDHREALAARAVRLLGRARAEGRFADAAEASETFDHPDFAPLRERDDFRKVREGLFAPSKK